MPTFKELKEKYKNLYEAISDLHKTSEKKNRGHGFDHDISVASYALKIAGDEKTANTAFVAGLIHSIDRLVSSDSVSKKVKEMIEMTGDNFSESEKQEIYFAVLEHSHISPEHKSETQKILQDSDKLANLSPSVIIRSGQFSPHLPIYEHNYLYSINPESTYADPKSILDDIRTNIRDYMPIFHIEKAKQIAVDYIEFLKEYEKKIQKELEFLDILEN